MHATKINKGFLIVFMLITYFQLYSDTVASSNWIWASKMESSSQTYFPPCSDMAVDNNGNTYVAGVFSEEIQFGSIVLPCQGNYNMYLAKLNSNGVWLWAKRFTTDDNNLSVYQKVKKIKVLGDSVFLLGYSFFPMVIDGVVFESNSVVYPQGPFIAKFSDSGTCNMGVVLNPSAGQLNNFINFDQLAVNSSSMYVAGSWHSTNVPYQFGDFTVNGYDDGDYTDYDILYARIDNQGNLLWIKTIGGPSDEEITSMCCDSSGNVYMGGEFASTMIAGSAQLVSNGFIDAFVIKLDQNGDVVWGQKCGGVRDDTLAELRERNGVLFLTGTYRMQAHFGSLNLEPFNTTNLDNVYFASITTSGTWNSVNRIGLINSYLPWVSSIVVDNINAYILLPAASAYIYTPLQFGEDFSWYPGNTQSLTFNHIIAGLNISTNHWFGLSYAECGTIYAFTKLDTNDQFLYLGTPVIDQATFGNIDIIATTNSCYAIGKISKNEVVENDDETTSPPNIGTIRIYPNPSGVQSTVSIEYDRPDNFNTSINVYNIRGQIVKRFNEVAKSGILMWNRVGDNGIECPSGIYFIKLRTNNGINTHKFLLSK